MQSMTIRPVLAVVLAVMAGPALALDFLVNSNLDVAEATPGDGQCNPINAVGNTCTLRAAIMEANANPGPHNIFLPSGSYNLDLTGIDEDAAATGDLDILADIRIVNGTDNPPLVLGNFSDRVFDVHEGAGLTLVNLGVANGMANAPGNVHGGGIRVNAGAELELDQVTVSTNIANIGGGIYNDGTVLIADSEFFHNALLDDNANSDFTDGAAIFNRGVLSIERSTFRNNGVFPGGSGLLTNEYAIHSRQGIVSQPLVLISNSTFYENTNGIFSDGVNTGISFSTLVDNNARGIRFLPDIDSLGDLQFQIHQTVVVGHDGDCNGIPDDQPEYDVTGNANASSDETCGFSGIGDFQNIANPFNGTAGDHGGKTPTFMPRSNGILVDPATGDCGPMGGNEDQRGKARPIDGDSSGGATCDIGAVEFDPGTDPELGDGLFGDRFEEA
ncbi:choice-of-anchor Q domain-containing protein [Wenzhouxiangella sediminis]|uniref:CSLREA domain-containing protein n=1 Tax=Wenzhouxiangella sediminis TaxID=1792836 RepID=A0A3E1KCF5_9GAMM|nr:choice-of-anchor Q domain-containing protein [Wenzhouxiangella sediminis]RFF32587.1 hypothetical protein DZC52_01190 [Wenzhouxiangella sediminis]